MNLVFVLRDDRQFSPGLFSALSRHSALICQSLSQAKASIAEFSPQLILVDTECLLADSGPHSIRKLIVFARDEALNSWASDSFQSLTLPASAVEFEEFLSGILHRFRTESQEVRQIA